MNPLTTRWRFFGWLLILLILFIVFQSTIFIAFEYHEWRITEHHNLNEEVDELLLILGVDAVMVPVLLIIMWLIANRMLLPLALIARTAQRIRSGHFAERIQARNQNDELGILAATINQAFDRYQDAVDRLRRFTADASHQLRTPLAAIRSTGEVAIQRDRRPEEYRQTLESILEEAQRLSHIVEQLLTLARLDEPRVQAAFSRVDFSGVVTTACGIYEPMAQDKKIALELDVAPDACVKGEPALLEQVMVNLLDNAIKFTPQGGRVHVRLAPGRNGMLELSVSDTGPGIPPEYRSRIFERFNRLPGSGPDGCGLGLAIVADIVKVHGGRAEVESPSGRGATLHVRLPAGS